MKGNTMKTYEQEIKELKAKIVELENGKALYDQPSEKGWLEYMEKVRYSNSKVCWNCREVII